jgi:hypothetical protein
MPSLATLAYWEAVVLIGGLCGGVLWQMMSGKIDLAYLLDADVRDGNGGEVTEVSQGRVQAMVVTLYVAFYYLVQVVHHPTEFPPLPSEMLYALGGSHALYLGAKAKSLLLGDLGELLNKK